MYLALGPTFGPVLDTQRRLLWLPGVAILTIFEVMGEMVIYSSYQLRSGKYLIIPYHHISVNTTFMVLGSRFGLVSIARARLITGVDSG